MRIAFPAFRRGFFKVTGPVIDEAIRRGHAVYLVRDYDSKPGEAVHVRELMARWPDAVTIPRVFAAGIPVDATIGDPSIHTMTDLPGKHYALDFVWEQRMRPALSGVVRCWASDYHRQLFGEPSPLDQRDYWAGPVTGMTALDGLTAIDPVKVRASLSVPEGRTIVVLFALKFSVPNLYRRTFFKWFPYRKLLMAVRRYCDKRDALLIIKTRTKNQDPPFVAALADHVVTDTDLYPYTALQLMTVADLAIHFQSGAVFEAAAANVPQLAIRIPQPHIAHLPGHDVFFSRDPRSLQYWPGVVQSADLPEAIRLLDSGRVWRSVDRRAREHYAEQYLGPLDGKASARVLDLVERG